jgi:modification methylase
MSLHKEEPADPGTTACADIAPSPISPRKAIDRVFHKDARSMEEVDDNSVALVVTSPPYFAGKEYELFQVGGVPDEDRIAEPPATFAEYLRMLEEVFAECAKKLEWGGRIAVNVANLGKRPFVPLSSEVASILRDRLGLMLRAEIVWRKGRGASGSCAWGSYCDASNPVTRDVTERIVVASKGTFHRWPSRKERRRLELPYRSDISPEEFMEATLDLWEIPPAAARKVGHPAPFPVELPERLILLYTYVGDLVLDPFMGSGTTAIAAIRHGRHFVGYETVGTYVQLANSRIEEERRRLARLPHSIAGARTLDRARDLLLKAGLEPADTKRAAATKLVANGLEVDLVAKNADGKVFRFLVVGRPTVVPDSLRRPEQLARTVGLATLAKIRFPLDGFGVIDLSECLPPKQLLKKLLADGPLDLVLTETVLYLSKSLCRENPLRAKDRDLVIEVA